MSQPCFVCLSCDTRTRVCRLRLLIHAKPLGFIDMAMHLCVCSYINGLFNGCYKTQSRFMAPWACAGVCISITRCSERQNLNAGNCHWVMILIIIIWMWKLTLEKSCPSEFQRKSILWEPKVSACKQHTLVYKSAARCLIWSHCGTCVHISPSALGNRCEVLTSTWDFLGGCNFRGTCETRSYCLLIYGSAVQHTRCLTSSTVGEIAPLTTARCLQRWGCSTSACDWLHTLCIIKQ